MIAKIGRGKSLYGALSYNYQKIEKENGQILHTQMVMESHDGKYSVSGILRSFETYLVANRNTEKPILHISLNPDPKDQVSDEKFRIMATQYMKEMGYGKQPFVVFKHTDIERTHIHIVSVCVDEQGRKISDRFEKRRSMKICRDLERKYGLAPLTSNREKQDNTILLRPVDYKKGDIKSQIASVVRHLPTLYRFQTLGEYNALLSLFNITTEKVEGELHGKPKQGLIYFALNENREKASPPFKASLFGKSAGYTGLDLHFVQSKEILKNAKIRNQLRNNLATAFKASRTEIQFKKILDEQNMYVIVRRTDTGRIYGVTFIDHRSKTVWNGSRLGKEFSANIFNDWWNNGKKPDHKFTEETHAVINDKPAALSPPASTTHNVFDFLDKTESNSIDNGVNFIEMTGGLLPESQGEDYAELAFINAMNKKKKRRPRKQN